MKRITAAFAVLCLLASGCASGTSASAGASSAAASSSTAAVDGGEQKLVLSDMPFPTGDLGAKIQIQEPKELTEEETAEAERASRAYVPSATSYLKNMAKEFYYYSQLDKEAQGIYDALYMVADDPVSPDNIVIYSTDMDPKSDEFMLEMYRAYYGILYDHPELFWLYNDSKASIGYDIPRFNSQQGKNDVYFRMLAPYDDFEKDMKEFNEAAEKFLADIDLTKTEEEITKAIHDKLILNVRYDLEVMEKSLGEDVAHTAYGALVKNSRGDKNTAVCDGYSLAYEYLLQQAGITAAVLVGIAGNDEETAGGHAWNIVKINGAWKEIDSTWDDMGTLEEELQAYKGDIVYDYYTEALNNKEYRESIEHYLYSISTSEMKNYDPGENYMYYSEDGLYAYSLVGPSVHLRASEITGWEPYDQVVSMAPTAN